MITIKTIPVGNVALQTYLVEIDESLCKPFSVSCGTPPSASVAFQTGAITQLNGFIIVPVIATVVLNTPSGCACGGCNTKTFIERFELPFVATDVNAVTLTPGASVITEVTSQKCDKARSVRISTTLRITIA